MPRRENRDCSSTRPATEVDDPRLCSINRPYFVYLVRFADTGTYKVGISDSPGSRMNNLASKVDGSTQTPHRGILRTMAIIGLVMCEDRETAEDLEQTICIGMRHFGTGDVGRNRIVREFFTDIPPQLAEWFRRRTWQPMMSGQVESSGIRETLPARKPVTSLRLRRRPIASLDVL